MGPAHRDDTAGDPADPADGPLEHPQNCTSLTSSSRRARDAQLILGHSRLAITQEIYGHENRQAQLEALQRISVALRNQR
jgi:hypothetical protein